MKVSMMLMDSHIQCSQPVIAFISFDSRNKCCCDESINLVYHRDHNKLMLTRFTTCGKASQISYNQTRALVIEGRSVV